MVRWFWDRHTRLKKIQSKSKPEITEALFSDSEKVIPLQLNLTEFTSIKNKSIRVLKNKMVEGGLSKITTKESKKSERLKSRLERKVVWVGSYT